MGVLKLLSLLLPVLALALSYYGLRSLAPRERGLRLLLMAGLALLTTDIHYMQVDKNGQLHAESPNEVWQKELHREVLAFSPGVIPHSYRFLPDMLVGGLEALNGSYNTSRALYRISFQLLLFTALYVFARIFVNDMAALLSLALYAAIYPVSVRFYNGQLTDPMSHLSFVLSYIFIYRRRWGALALVFLGGVLAKESVAAMGIFAIWWHRRSAPDRNRALATFGGTLLFLWLVRKLVLGGVELNYSHASGVGFDHIARNWAYSKLWVRQFIFTFGIFVPFLIWGWRRVPAYLRETSLYLLVVLSVTNLLFSWMMESRNLVPLTLVLVVVTAGALSRSFSAE